MILLVLERSYKFSSGEDQADLFPTPNQEITLPVVLKIVDPTPSCSLDDPSPPFEAAHESCFSNRAPFFRLRVPSLALGANFSSSIKFSPPLFPMM